ncbi:tyrosine-type recombinase/integrase [Dactylosporangium sp. CA-139114]|uniref:tyrosine-type recombinase/integrase n=1 Tax=Dactylosporangium sp. CA-139114 TaxID=3239931 RepID=UPI003D95FD8B
MSDTMQTLCEDWLTAREQQLQPNTVYSYRCLLHLIYPYVGRVRASRLSAGMAEHAYQQLEAAGYSRTTLRTLHLILTKAFGEQTGRTLGAHKPRETDDLRPVWTLSEALTFLDHVAGDRLYPLWRLLLTTGLRRGELCGLQWCDLEPDLGALTVRRQRVVEDPTSRVRDQPPKSHNGNRTVILDRPPSPHCSPSGQPRTRRSPPAPCSPAATVSRCGRTTSATGSTNSSATRASMCRTARSSHSS